MKLLPQVAWKFSQAGNYEVHAGKIGLNFEGVAQNLKKNFLSNR